MTQTGKIQTGDYTIKNVGTSKYANLVDGNSGTPVTSIGDDDLETIKVNFIRLLRAPQLSRRKLVDCDPQQQQVHDNEHQIPHQQGLRLFRSLEGRLCYCEDR